MDKNEPVVISMKMKTFDEDEVKKELVMGEDRAEEASNIRDSPDSGNSGRSDLTLAEETLHYL